MTFKVSSKLIESCSGSAARQRWLRDLPRVVDETVARWQLRVGQPFDGDDVSCSWVATVTLAAGTPAVLKLGMPHMEAEGEASALRFLDGDAAVRLLDFDEKHNAMLLERCEPGTPLRQLPEAEQDIIVAALLRRFWRSPGDSNSFRPLSAMVDYWTGSTKAGSNRWADASLVEDGLQSFAEMLGTTASQVLLATDLHAGNILRSHREPWLVIDPKPFIGDPAYDLTQHLLNCRTRLRAAPAETIRSFSDLAGVDPDRVLKWTFARLAAEPRDDWDDEATALAKIVGRHL